MSADFELVSLGHFYSARHGGRIAGMATTSDVHRGDDLKQSLFAFVFRRFASIEIEIDLHSRTRRHVLCFVKRFPICNLLPGISCPSHQRSAWKIPRLL